MVILLKSEITNILNIFVSTEQWKVYTIIEIISADDINMSQNKQNISNNDIKQFD